MRFSSAFLSGVPDAEATDQPVVHSFIRSFAYSVIGSPRSSRSAMEWLGGFGAVSYPNEVGPGGVWLLMGRAAKHLRVRGRRKPNCLRPLPRWRDRSLRCQVRGAGTWTGRSNSSLLLRTSTCP